MPADGPLLERGIYRFIRHPMYAGALLFVVASVLGHRSRLTVSIGLLVAMLLVARVVVEERLLNAHYPGYRAYAQRTKRLIPFVF